MNGIHIPDQELTFTLSVKEAMALASGVRFYLQPSIAAEARRKMRSTLERTLLPEADKLHYHLLKA